ncbi:MAG: thioredoxin [Tenacibaculum sp.]
MVLEITDDIFEEVVLNSNIPVLVDFWAEWCGPCKMIAPIVDEISREYKEKIVVGKVNVDENHQFAVKYGVKTIPTVLIFKNGEVVDRQLGAVPKKEYTDKIDAYL